MRNGEIFCAFNIGDRRHFGTRKRWKCTMRDGNKTARYNNPERWDRGKDGRKDRTRNGKQMDACDIERQK